MKNTYAELTSLLDNLDIAKVKAQPGFDDTSVFSLSSKWIDTELEEPYMEPRGRELPFLNPDTHEVRIPKNHSHSFDPKNHSQKFDTKNHSHSFEAKNHSHRFHTNNHSHRFVPKNHKCVNCGVTVPEFTKHLVHRCAW